MYYHNLPANSIERLCVDRQTMRGFRNYRYERETGHIIRQDFVDRYGPEPEQELNCLISLQNALRNALECKVAYSGSLALYLQNEPDVTRYGDIDLWTERHWEADELQERLNISHPVNRVFHTATIGNQWWQLNLDIWFVYSDYAAAHLDASKDYLTRLPNGLWVQDPEYVMGINHKWERMCGGGKKRKTKEPSPELAARLANIPCH